MNSAESPPKRFFARGLTLRQVLTRSSLAAAGGAILVAVVVGVASLDGTASPASQTDQRLLSVETVTVSPVDEFERRRTFTGVIKAARSTELGFERTGRLVVVEVEQGDRVAAGQVLAKLQIRNLEAKRRELTAQRAAAQALLDELLAGPRQETIAAARADVRDLQAQLELAKLNFQRSKELLPTNAISREEYDKKFLGMQSAEARLDATQRQLDELEAGTRTEQIEAQRAVVAQLDAGIENVTVDIEDSTLTAPFDGTIARRHLDEGTIVAPGTPLLRIVEGSSLEAWIGLPTATASALDNEGDYQVEVAGHTYAAKLDSVLPELDAATRTQTAVFRLADAQERVVPAQVARIEIAERTEAQGFWLPATALTRGSRGLWSVLVVETDAALGKSVAARRDVELLYTDGDRVLARGTLQSGDAAIVGGTHRLVAGQPVEVQN